MIRVFGKDVEVVSDIDVIRDVVGSAGQFAAWMGAGASTEAGVKTAAQICRELRDEIEGFERPPEPDEWARTTLAWDDPRRRYSTCLLRYARAPARRVQYFKRLIEGVQPSFAHHALCLLVGARIVQRTCFTTNFDKLLEMAFAQQGFSEYQAIRSEEETAYWGQDSDKCYVLKLHGDYDTYNILNTTDETIKIHDRLQAIALGVLRHGGLLVVGSSGYETSVQRLMVDLLAVDDHTAPQMGVYWGVYVEGSRPPAAGRDEVAELVAASLKNGNVSRDVIDLFAGADSPSRPCAFFPIWGTGTFFYDLVAATGRRALIGQSHRYLDHRMRLRHVFREGGLSPEAIARRLDKLEGTRRRLSQDWHLQATEVKRAVTAQLAGSHTTVKFWYGDVTSRSLMGSDEFGHVRRAVISPDDNFISAGGGAARALLQKAGAHTLLHEIAKFEKIAHRDVVLTSGGDLPVHYILHAAATCLEPDGTSRVTGDDVTETVSMALDVAATHRVAVVFTPLIGTGNEGMAPALSLTASLEAAKRFGTAHPDTPLTLVFVARGEDVLSRHEVRDCLVAAPGATWTVSVG